MNKESIPLKVLIISYYWPPSGGAGVQRWVKLSKYLSRLNCECFIVTVDSTKSSYNSNDESLNHDIEDDVQVYKTDSFEIINVFSKIFGKKHVPSSGFSNVDHSSKKQRLVNFLRSNLFIPDPRVGWNNYAFAKAKEVISKEGIQNVITTSPPHSSQLIGLRLKKWKPSLNWVADLRDPWTDIYYYDLLNHSKISHSINLKKEKSVLDTCDHLVTVSNGVLENYNEKTETDLIEKSSIIPNGFDMEDFKLTKEKQNTVFTIVYTGSIGASYDSDILFQALKNVLVAEKIEYLIKMVGSFSDDFRKTLNDLELAVDFVGHVSHKEVVKYQVEADLLILIIPKTATEKGILTGKLFEYLATKNRILSLGPIDGDAAEIIRECGSGTTVDRSAIENIEKEIEKEVSSFKLGTYPAFNNEAIQKYSRNEQAKEYKNLLIEAS